MLLYYFDLECLVAVIAEQILVIYGFMSFKGIRIKFEEK